MLNNLSFLARQAFKHTLYEILLTLAVTEFNFFFIGSLDCCSVSIADEVTLSHVTKLTALQHVISLTNRLFSLLRE